MLGSQSEALGRNDAHCVTQRRLCLAAAVLIVGIGCSHAEQIDVSGVWLPEKPSKEIRTSEGELPPLRSEFLELYEQRLASLERGDNSFDPVEAKCAMPGLTRMHFIPYPVQIFQNELRVAFVYEFNHNFRSVSITDQQPVAPWETAYGLGAAQFIDDKLVVRTSGLIDETFLDSMGMPHSNALNVTETYRLLRDGDKLEVTLEFSDQEAFSSPWTTIVTYRRLRNYQLAEDICLDRTSLGGPAIDWNN